GPAKVNRREPRQLRAYGSKCREGNEKLHRPRQPERVANARAVTPERELQRSRQHGKQRRLPEVGNDGVDHRLPSFRSSASACLTSSSVSLPLSMRWATTG